MKRTIVTILLKILDMIEIIKSLSRVRMKHTGYYEDPDRRDLFLV